MLISISSKQIELSIHLTLMLNDAKCFVLLSKTCQIARLNFSVLHHKLKEGLSRFGTSSPLKFSKGHIIRPIRSIFHDALAS